MTQKVAVQYLADGTRGCAIPVDPHAFQRKRFTAHDCVFFGPTAIRAYKHANRWKFTEQDLHQAVRTLTFLPWDPDDLVEATIPPAGAEYRTRIPGSPCPPWREQLRRAIDGAARRVREEHGCDCGPDPWRCAGVQVGPEGLPCGLTRQAFMEHTSGLSIACLQPTPCLHWVDDTWMIPRTLAQILESWQETEERLSAAAGQCSTCGAAEEEPLAWRTTTTNGLTTLCPTCAVALRRPYRNELQGTSYARVREHGPSAEDFLCTVCDTPRPACYWDHCHDHDLIRGPLCAGCNGREYHGKEFITYSGSVTHLLRCTGCRNAHALPRHHRPGALRHHLHHNAAPDCAWPTHMHVLLTEREDGGYDYTLRCSTAATSRHSGTLAASEVEDILNERVRHG